MGYFANGTEGCMYEEEYCSQCQHGQDAEKACPVWGLHLKHNYDQHGDTRLAGVLNALIPREGIYNGECRMFLPLSLPVMEMDE